jgi:hypothetical protein
MLSVLIQPSFRHRHPVGGVTPNDSRNSPNKIIGLAGDPEISCGSLSVFPTSRARLESNPLRGQYFFLNLGTGEHGEPIEAGSFELQEMRATRSVLT